MSARALSFSVSGIKHYENDYYTNSPCSFAAVSLTGPECGCHCAHCGGLLLKSMSDGSSTEKFVAFADKAYEAGCSGILVSGGADAGGAVPVLARVDEIAYAKKKGLRVVVHTGLIDQGTALALRAADVDRVSFDIIGSAKTIRDVCGIDRTPDDYYKSMVYCKNAGLPLAPHIVVGLDFGKIEGEYEAVDAVRRARAESLVLVVLVPKRGTGMEGVSPPPLPQVVEVFEYASRTLTGTRIALGCARPAAYSVELERSAIELGFDAIAYPHGETIRYAGELGLMAGFYEECCCLDRVCRGP